MFLSEKSVIRWGLNLRDIVNVILLQHDGHISIFTLVLSGVNVDNNLLIDQWISFLAKNGLVELKLDYSGHDKYPMSPCIFSLPKLRILSITNCFLMLLYATEGFHKLYILRLIEVSILENVGSNVLNTPHLRNLYLTRCSGVGLLKLHAPLLYSLAIFGCGIVELSTFLVMRLLRLVHISHSTVKIWGKDYKNVSHFPTLYRSWPNLQQLQINEFLYQDMVPIVMNNWINLKCLSCLRLPNFNPTNVKYLSGVLGLLGSIPNLSTLEINIKASVPNSSSHPRKLMQSIWNCPVS